MVSKAVIKLVQSLKHKKAREQHGLFVVEGTKTIVELLGSKITVKSLFATQSWWDEHRQIIAQNIEVNKVTITQLEQLSNFNTPPPVIALCEMPNYSINSTMLRCIALDTIQDPGNLGTIIRIADWYGIEHIICSTACTDVHNPKTLQASMGSFLRVKTYYTDLKQFFETTTLPIMGALMQGSNLHTTHLPKQGILVIGNEGKGLQQELLPFITLPVTIPKFGEAESLNAAIATAIICDAWSR
jgi:RNA methyltransferase, TrmH family